MYVLYRLVSGKEWDNIFSLVDYVIKNSGILVSHYYFIVKHRKNADLFPLCFIISPVLYAAQVYETSTWKGK